jgi:hypothetical protein
VKQWSVEQRYGQLKMVAPIAIQTAVLLPERFERAGQND